MKHLIQSIDEMERFAAQIAEQMVGGETLGLVGDLGAGKTHFCKGFVAALGHHETVTSPTFGLVHEYRSGRLPVFHWDFYRLESAADLLSVGWDECLDQEGVMVAEWADRFPEIMPAATRWLTIEILPNGQRKIINGRAPHPTQNPM